MSEREDRVYLLHIVDAAKKIADYIDGLEEEDFLEESNSLVQDGVIRQLEIIGEATKNISEEVRKTYSDIPWKDMAGMRDKLIHQYFGTDIELLWRTAIQDVPQVRDAIIAIVE